MLIKDSWDRVENKFPWFKKKSFLKFSLLGGKLSKLLYVYEDTGGEYWEKKLLH